ncbi:hypothetical protein HDU76_010073 [Blyttiomyces sp. JEL0837]|nr:hypothetical protein HDU76_010073 [Blyttiomyces sp. JEL0837]
MIDTTSKEGTMITLLGLGSNVALTLGKGLGGIVWGSASLLADAVHSLTDLVSDFVTLIAYQKARSARDPMFPYGYGKLEPLGALTISGLLLFAGVGAGYHSFILLQEHLSHSLGDATASMSETISKGHDHLHTLFNIDVSQYSLDNPTIAALALGMAAGSILIKELLFWATLRVAKRTNSDVLVANAWHHRADSASGLVAFVAVGGAYFGFPLLDPIGGILVSGMIVQASLSMVMPALRELSDYAPKGTIERVAGVLKDAVRDDSNIVGYHSIRARKMGPDVLVDLQLQVNPRISVSMSHQISENVRHAIYSRVEGITEVLIHVDVEEHDNMQQPKPTMLPTSDIEEDLARAAIRGLEDKVKKVSHIKVHYLNGGLEVEAEILLVNEDKLQFKEAIDIADQVQTRLLSFPGVISADVHLETSEHDGSKDKRAWRSLRVK